MPIYRVLIRCDIGKSPVWNLRRQRLGAANGRLRRFRFPTYPGICFGSASLHPSICQANEPAAEISNRLILSGCFTSKHITLPTVSAASALSAAFSSGQKHGRGPPRRARGKLSERMTRIMDIGFIAWEHAPRSGVPRLLERLRPEQSHTPPSYPRHPRYQRSFSWGPEHGQGPPRRARGKLSKRITRIMCIACIA